MVLNPDSLFAKAVSAGASDVHVVVGQPPLLRIDGELAPQGTQTVTKSAAESFVKSVLGATGFAKLKELRELDTAFTLKSGARLRVNCHYERGNVGLAARVIPREIPSLEDVGFTELLMELCALDEGLVLFTGPTGAGKSTSLAAMIQHVNATRATNIVTLEDPIEFLFPSGKSIIRQREYGADFLSFPEALKHVLRQDPNIVMVGEMRDHETIAAALTLAETGHVILATLHTPNAVQAVDRIIDVFPPHQQAQVRTQLSLSLRAVVAQRLVPGAKSGRIAVRECLVATPAVANIIRENRAQELTSVLQSGRAQGMCTFAQDARRLLKEGSIDKETYEWVEAIA
ncbi:type IV pili twitching motility protein PilT [Candidatus Peregrinibacteria bacterium CG10_big_fil_rev_8_21_14_0_10_55_24]|nr:MAG: type IV pili twitching motility protein PilT [Candidatus Peregrinibacteria bacterium CG10_big_fil_rev_8_21_14_0_10_55_24]